jgi:hypothetical protein
MSTTIIFNEIAFRCADVDGQPVFAIFGEYGSSNVQGSNGRIPRRWQFWRAGTAQQLMANATENAAAAQGRCIALGNEYNDRYKSIDARGFIQRHIDLLQSALPTQRESTLSIKNEGEERKYLSLSNESDTRLLINAEGARVEVDSFYLCARQSPPVALNALPMSPIVPPPPGNEAL